MKTYGIWIALLVCAATATNARADTAAGGSRHAVVIASDGTVWTWGGNNTGQLGDGSTTDRRLPAPVTLVYDAVAVAAGSMHTLALLNDGTVFAWGLNSSGQLGDGSTTQRTQPVAVAGLTNIVAIAAGQYHSLALTSGGDVYAWGLNSTGQLGDGTTTNREWPVLVGTLSSVTGITAGEAHSAALKSDGTAWSWGANNNGQLGDGTTTGRTAPVQMIGVSGGTAIAAGNIHTVVLKGTGTLLSTGWNGSGELGDSTYTQRTTAVAVSGLTNVVQVAVGAYSSYVVRSDGTVWSWGYNQNGRLGDGTTTNRTTAVQVLGLSAIGLVAGGDDFGIAVSTTGVVSTWGDNSWGKLGDGTLEVRRSPVAISGPGYDWKVATPTFGVPEGSYNDSQWVVVTCATPGAVIHYTLDGNEPTESDPTIASGTGLTIDQSWTLRARAWKSGMPASNITSATYTLYLLVTWMSPGATTYATPQNVTLATPSSGATIRYTTDGTTPTESSTAYTAPIPVATTTTITARTFRTGWTPGMVASGTYTMNFGTLTAPTVDPATDTYPSDVAVTMSAASGATIRYTTNGSSVSGSSPAYTGPIPLTATTTIKARAFHPDYAASAETTRTYTIVVATPQLSHTAGTYPAGQVVAVTTATTGATLRYTLTGATPTEADAIVPAGGIVLGNFTLKVGAWKAGTQASAIVTAAYAVSGTFTVPTVDTGSSHTLAVRGDGTVWAWGIGWNGRLGDGTGATWPLPGMLGTITGVTAVSAGDAHSLAVTTAGDLWSWGYNATGQLGSGSTSDRTRPGLVSGLTGVVAAAAGDSHSLVLLSDGTAWGFGRNLEGQVGDGTTTQRITPVQATGLSGVTAIAVGSNHSLAVTSDGHVWSWGTNGNGQLGTGNTIGRSTPGSVAGLTTATRVAAGSASSFALLSDGTVRAWGHNYAGALGDGTQTARYTPVTVGALANITALAIGETFGLALDGSGGVWSWGNNGNGQLGDGTQIDRWWPVQVQGLPAVVAIAAAAQHAFAVTADGAVWAWGRNQDYQLGDGTTTRRLLPVQIANAGMAWKVPTPVISVASGMYTAAFSATISTTDSSSVLHYTTNGTLPIESDPVVASGGVVSVPHSLLLKVRALKAGAVASEVASATYELKVLAPNLSPNAGLYGSTQNVGISTTTPGATMTYTTDGTEPTIGSTSYSAPVSVAVTRTVKARAFKTGWTPSDSTAASYIISAGTVATPTIGPAAGTLTEPSLITIACATTAATIRYTFDGSTPSLSSPVYRHPVLVTRTTTVKARAFVANYGASAVASAAYTLGPAGQSGLPSISPDGGRFATQQTVTITGPVGATLRYTLTGMDPTDADTTITSGATLVIDRARVLKVRAWETGLTPSSVQRADFVITGALAAGQQHSLALAADGTVYVWGRGDDGQIGDGAVVGRTAPVSVLADGIAIAGGRYFSLAVKADGTVRAWGQNLYGQLGDGSLTQRNTPVAVSGLTDVIAVAAGWEHALALKSDGTVWAWGRNDDGQLGDGTTTIRLTPVQVVGLSGITSISAGEGFSIALQRDGAAGGIVWAWGRNDRGQLGDGSTLNRPVPVMTLGVTDVASVAAGREFAVARMASGTLKAWGRNETAQLGGLSGGQSTTAVPVPVLTAATHLTAGSNHSLAIGEQGRVWGWGTTAEGQLGTLPYAFSTGIAIPQRISGASGMLAAAGGWQQTLMLKADGTVWAVGSTIATGLGGSATYNATQIPGLSLASNAWLLTDVDGDGLPSWEEYLAGVDPLMADTNGNGLSDFVDVRRQSEGGQPDDDGDGVPNVVELARGTDPFKGDTDGDSVSDLLDDYPLDSTRTQKPPANPSDTTPPVIILIYPRTAVPIGGGQ